MALAPRLLIALVVCIGTLAVAPRASAQVKPEVRVAVDNDVLDVGASIHLSLTVQSTEGMPQNAQIGATPGFHVRGPNVSPSQSISIINGVRTDKQGITATWSLQADKVGSYSVGPLTFAIGGKKYETNKVTLKVVPKGQAPQPQAQQGNSIFGPGFSPFDPWKGLIQPFGNDPDDNAGNGGMRAPQGPATDPRLALDAPRGELAFLHATIDKPRAVVGEQVTLTVYLYVDDQTSEPEFQDVHEVTAGDFLKKPLVEDERSLKLVGYAEVAGRRYAVQLLRKTALFPLKAGDLEIGPMTVGVARGRNAGSRESEHLRVRVSEPPVSGRPPGYTVGDVGRYALTAEVAPRTIERGAAVAVTIELSGSGNLPSALTPPMRPGVDWLEPATHEKVGAADGLHFGGQRTFAYVVRMKQEGAIDLGSFTLPYWDPDTKSYGVARAELGTVQVRPGSAPIAATEEIADPLPGLPGPRANRLGVRPSASHLADTPLFWVGIAAPPFAYAFALGAHAASRRLREGARRRATSPEAAARARIADADAASRKDDPRAALAAIVRAVEAATVAYVGVNVRGIAVDAVARALEEHGVDSATAHALRDTLDACGNARFSPEGHDIDAARKRWVDTQHALGTLARIPRGSA